MYFGKTCGARWPHRLYIDLPLIASMPVVFMIGSNYIPCGIALIHQNYNNKG